MDKGGKEEEEEEEEREEEEEEEEEREEEGEGKSSCRSKATSSCPLHISTATELCSLELANQITPLTHHWTRPPAATTDQVLRSR